MRQFTITTFGCKVNQYDGLAVATLLRQKGLTLARKEAQADWVVVNTCCVTATAARKSRQALRRAVRRAPGARVLVLGCYGVYDRTRIRRMLRTLRVPDENIRIVGHHENLADCVSQFLQGDHRPPIDETPWTPGNIKSRRKKALHSCAAGAEHLPLLERFDGHQRAFVKIQDGCDAFCNYCIVPYTRPRVWSRPRKAVLEECEQLIRAGHREIVLCGVFLGAYGRDSALRRTWGDRPSPLPDLLRAVADLPGLWRVRLSSLEPGDLSGELLDVMQSHPAVAPHLHLPLQSGSQRILTRMNRQYTAREYVETIRRLRAGLDRPAVTTDVIVGYPGETEDDFARTLTVAREVGFAKIHIFPFSPLEPTGAWRRRHEAPDPDVVRRRRQDLAELETKLAQTYRKQFVGETIQGLVERSEPDRPRRRAMTDRYLTVTFDAPDVESTGQVVRLRIEATTPQGLRGVIVH